jgi:hypothetical protein
VHHGNLLGLDHEVGHPIRTKVMSIDRIILLQLLAWLAWAAWLLPNHGHLGPDEAYFYNETLRVVQEGTFPVFGAPISGTEPPTLTPGGAVFLLYAPAFVFGVDPRLGVLWLIALTAFAIWFMDRTFRQLGLPELMRLLIAVFVTWSAWHTVHSDRIWNPHLFFVVSPVLLALALKLRRQFQADGTKPPPVFHCLIFGVVSGVALQIHPGGTLAVAACGLMILLPAPVWGPWPWTRLLRLVGVGAIGLLLTYLPYLWHEFHAGFVNTQHLRSGIPASGANWRAVAKSLIYPYIYASHFSSRVLKPQSLMEATVLALQLASLLIGLAATVQFYRCSPALLRLPQEFWKESIAPFRILSIASLAMLPVAFFLSQRDYYHHYVSSVIPYFIISAAVGTYLAIQRWVSKKRTILVLVGIWVIAGLVTPTYRYLWVSRAFASIPDSLEKTQALLQSGKPVPIPEDGRLIMVWWSLAKNVFHEELLFQNDRGEICRVQIVRAVGSAATEMAPFVSYLPAYLVCEKPSAP